MNDVDLRALISLGFEDEQLLKGIMQLLCLLRLVGQVSVKSKPGS